MTAALRRYFDRLRTVMVRLHRGNERAMQVTALVLASAYVGLIVMTLFPPTP